MVGPGSPEQGLAREEAVRRVVDSYLTPRLRGTALRGRGRRLVIGVAGSAGLGKTAFCQELARTLNELGISAQHVPLDGYLLAREERYKLGVCGYEPIGWKLKQLAEDVSRLLEKDEPVICPSYDHSLGSYGSPFRAEPSTVIVFDGNACTYDPLKTLLTSSIFFASDLDTMEQLRFETDTTHRGYPADSA